MPSPGFGPREVPEDEKEIHAVARGGGNLASGYAHYGHRVSGPQIGAIAIMGRRGGGHVGVVSGIDANGNPVDCPPKVITTKYSPSNGRIISWYRGDGFSFEAGAGTPSDLSVLYDGAMADSLTIP